MFNYVKTVKGYFEISCALIGSNGFYYNPNFFNNNEIK